MAGCSWQGRAQCTQQGLWLPCKGAGGNTQLPLKRANISISSEIPAMGWAWRGGGYDDTGLRQGKRKIKINVFFSLLVNVAENH